MAYVFESNLSSLFNEDKFLYQKISTNLWTNLLTNLWQILFSYLHDFEYKPVLSQPKFLTPELMIHICCYEFIDRLKLPDICLEPSDFS